MLKTIGIDIAEADCCWR